jgi:DNA-binding transcriptional LysR family regulator
MALRPRSDLRSFGFVSAFGNIHRMIDLRLLSHAIALARYRSFARTAVALHITQPTLSRNIAALETVLGERLFERSKSGVKLTAFGEFLIARGRHIMESASALERDFKLVRGIGVDEVRVACGPFPIALSVPTAAGRMIEQHPSLRIETLSVDPRTATQSVLESQVDFGVYELSMVENETDLVTEAMPRHPMLFYCRAGHPLLKEVAPTIGRVLSYPLVATRLALRGSEAILPLTRYGQADGPTGDFLPPVKVDSIHVARDVVLASDAVSAAPRSTIASDLVAGRLAVIPVSAPWLHTAYGLVYRRSRTLAPAVLALMEHIRAVEREIERDELGSVHADGIVPTSLATAGSRRRRHR